MSPEKNNMKMHEKDVEKTGKAKAKELVTFAEEEQEGIKAKKAALKRVESQSCWPQNAVTIL